MVMTDQAVAAEIGRRIDQMRLERNMTQQEVADAVGLSRVSYAKLVSGQAKFSNVIAVLRALDQLHLVEQFVPDTVFSPIEQLKMQGRQRKRATGRRGTGKGTGGIDDAGKSKDDLDW